MSDHRLSEPLREGQRVTLQGVVEKWAGRAGVLTYVGDEFVRVLVDGEEQDELFEIECVAPERHGGDHG